MSLKHGILGLLGYGAMTGYELNTAFKSSLSFFWQAQTSQIYRELKSMEHAGWVTGEQVIQTEKPNKRVYTITQLGKSELSEWLAEPAADIRVAMNVRSAFLMRVFFAGELDSAHTLEMIKSFRAECLAAAQALGAADGSIADYSKILDSASKAEYWKLTALFGESYYRAMLKWADKAIAILQGEK